MKKIIILFPVILNGCMMAGMHGMHGGSHDRHTGAKFIKEVQTEGVTVVLEVPQLIAKEEAMLLVKIRDDSTGEFIANAEVFASIQEEQRVPDVKARPPVKKQFQVSASKQAYQLSHQFTMPGWYEIDVDIRRGNGDESPTEISMRKMIEVSEGSQSWMNSTNLFVAGGAGMVLMMGLMMGGVIF